MTSAADFLAQGFLIDGGPHRFVVQVEKEEPVPIAWQRDGEWIDGVVFGLVREDLESREA
jgi:hypothetical protein